MEGGRDGKGRDEGGKRKKCGQYALGGTSVGTVGARRCLRKCIERLARESTKGEGAMGSRGKSECGGDKVRGGEAV